MKPTNETLTILKNFSSINKSILIKEGNELSTIAITKNIFAKALITEKFPKEFAIYDLTEFLSGLTLFKEKEFEFDFSNDSYLLIKSYGSEVKYFYSDPDIIAAPPNKKLVMPTPEVQFVLNSDVLDMMIRSANVYQLPDLCVEGDGKEIHLTVKDKKNSTSNTYSMIVGLTENTFSYNFKMENIKILPGTYTVNISSKISQFINSELNVEYYVALEPDTN